MEALDNVINRIKDWFNQPGYVMLITTEKLVLKCISKTNYDKEFQPVTEYYENDLNKDMLRLHFETLQANIPADIKTFKEIVTYLKSLPLSSSNRLHGSNFFGGKFVRPLFIPFRRLCQRHL